MGKNDIIAELALAHTAEDFVALEAARLGIQQSADFGDLAQMVYIHLLEDDASRIERLYSKGELLAYVRGAVRKQFTNSQSEFNRTYTMYKRRTTTLPEDDTD